MTKMAVIVIIETDAPALQPDALEAKPDLDAVRTAVIEALPNLSRVVAIMPVQLAKLMISAHQAAEAVASLNDILAEQPSATH